VKKISALVKAELLVWARQSAGFPLEEAARKAQLQPQKLEAWERGEGSPTIPQLRKLARVYKRPLAVFYLAQAPGDFQAMRDFRRLPGEVAGNESPALLLEIRKARYRRELARELFVALAEEPPTLRLRARLAEDPEQVAERTRKALGLTHEVQTAWKTPYQAFNAWREAVERLGVLVFQAGDIDVGEMRGFCLSATELPTLVVNRKDHPHGRLFTLLHELAHLMLRQEGLCDLAEEDRRPPEEQRVEVFCNRVAAAVLMPRRELLREEIVMAPATAHVWAQGELTYLARRYRVSREAMLRRLVTLGKASLDDYREARWELQEKISSRTEPSTGAPPPDRMVVSGAGPTFVRLVLEGFYQEKITASDVSDYLEVRLKWMPKIERAVFGHSRGVWAFA